MEKGNNHEDELIDEMDVQLKKIPGIVFNYSQPIRDNVEEAVAGVTASLAVKIFGPDFGAGSVGQQGNGYVFKRERY